MKRMAVVATQETKKVGKSHLGSPKKRNNIASTGKRAQTKGPIAMTDTGKGNNSRSADVM